VRNVTSRSLAGESLHVLHSAIVLVSAATQVLVGCHSEVGSNHPPVQVLQQARSTAPATIQVKNSVSVSDPLRTIVNGSRPNVSTNVGMFVRIGKALVPFACIRSAKWVSAGECIPTSVNQVAILAPPMVGEPGSVKVDPKKLLLSVSDKSMEGMLIQGGPGSNVIDGTTPFLGFGFIGRSTTVRFSAFAVERLVSNSDEWCADARNACRHIERSTLQSMLDHDASGSDVRKGVSVVSEALRKAVGETSGVAGVRSFVLSDHDGSRKFLEIAVNTGEWTGSQAQKLELGPSIFFVVGIRPNFEPQLVSLPSAGTFGLGEAGRVLGVTDLDGDGSDELILEWSYSEGADALIVSPGASAFSVIGRFGSGG